MNNTRIINKYLNIINKINLAKIKLLRRFSAPEEGMTKQ
jgi:hypothetical protein